ncbi:MFS transporter [Longispora albida]|uniref:MFS transporter n=1 Tax=Longispora albida TaxID=203523 RepID=UPI0003AA9B52|nr:MFS transporter [Longispora albida]
MSVSTPLTVGDPQAGERPGRAERLLLPATFITNLGNNIQVIAAALLLIQANKEGSVAFAVSWLFIAVAIPQMLLSVYFGRLADRFDRRTMCIIADVCSMVAAASLPAFLLLGGNAGIGVYIGNFALACFAAVFMPASNGLVKERIPEARLGKFNANFDIATQAGTLMSAAIGGFMIQWFGAEPMLFFNSLTFLGSAVLLFLMGKRPADPAPAAVPAGVTGPAPEPAEPTFTLVKAPVVRLSMFVSLVFVTITLSNVLNPVFVMSTLKKGAGAVGIVDTMAAIGFLIGGVLYKRISARFGNFTIAVAAFVLCAVLTAFQASFGLVGMIVLLALGALVLCHASVAARTLLMTSVPENKVSGVFGAVNAFRLGFATVAALTISKFADDTNIEYAFFAFGGLMLVVSVVTALTLMGTPKNARAASW